MEKSPKTYWAVYGGFNKTDIIFDGSFSQCWEWFTKKYKGKTLGELTAAGFRIARKG